MQSFVLSETLKYFYLLFLDASHSHRNLIPTLNASRLPPRFDHERWVFTTEAHPLPITFDSVNTYQRDLVSNQPPYSSPRRPYAGNTETTWEAWRRRRDWTEKCGKLFVLNNGTRDKAQWAWFERNRLDLTSDVGLCYRSQWEQALGFGMWKTY
jgi:hypothetical protein